MLLFAEHSCRLTLGTDAAEDARNMPKTDNKSEEIMCPEQHQHPEFVGLGSNVTGGPKCRGAQARVQGVFEPRSYHNMPLPHFLCPGGVSVSEVSYRKAEENPPHATEYYVKDRIIFVTARRRQDEDRACRVQLCICFSTNNAIRGLIDWMIG